MIPVVLGSPVVVPIVSCNSGVGSWVQYVPGGTTGSSGPMLVPVLVLVYMPWNRLQYRYQSWFLVRSGVVRSRYRYRSVVPILFLVIPV